jgi:hypothetical protein
MELRKSDLLVDRLRVLLTDLGFEHICEGDNENYIKVRVDYEDVSVCFTFTVDGKRFRGLSA